jgi:hypothetical protein
MRYLRHFFVICIILILFGQISYAQSFGTCSSASIEELRQNIKKHDEHTFRMEAKFLNQWYKQDKLPSDFQGTSLSDIKKFLEKLKPRQAGVLFYSYKNENGRLCTWFITHDGIECATQKINVKGLKFDLPNGNNDSIDENILRSMSEILLPECVTKKLVDRRIDTLVIVPIFSIGAVPFSALHVKGKMVVDYASVIVAPGFNIFRENPIRGKRDFSKSVIAGDPVYPPDLPYDLPPLRWAKAEAEEIAKIVNNKSPLIGQNATMKEIEGRIRAMENSIDLVYIGTHGNADRTNPLDASLLFFSDGAWSARTIQNLPLLGSRPLVVLSACQSGLGKDFEVGTIGMTRAWHRAGASNVVMSLWSIYDFATPKLMIRFIRWAQKIPPDKALQKAMLETRSDEPNLVLWSGFTVFGAPQKLD